MRGFVDYATSIQKNHSIFYSLFYFPWFDLSLDLYYDLEFNLDTGPGLDLELDKNFEIVKRDML